MEQNIIYGTIMENVDHYEIHNGKGKALTHANTWQNPNKKTKSFDTLKEAIEHLSSTKRQGKIVEFIQLTKCFKVKDSSVQGTSSEIIEREVHPNKIKSATVWL